jgi:hypothetical protein
LNSYKNKIIIIKQIKNVNKKSIKIKLLYLNNLFNKNTYVSKKRNGDKINIKSNNILKQIKNIKK